MLSSCFGQVSSLERNVVISAQAANSQPPELVLGLRNFPIFVSTACDSEESYIISCLI